MMLDISRSMVNRYLGQMGGWADACCSTRRQSAVLRVMLGLKGPVPLFGVDKPALLIDLAASKSEQH